jgi:glutamine amidotransferase-like uncharacterized protein
MRQNKDRVLISSGYKVSDFKTYSLMRRTSAIAALLLVISLAFIGPAYADTVNAIVQNDKIRVALFTDQGARPRTLLKDYLSRLDSIEFSLIDALDIDDGCLDKVDVLIMPGGSGRKEAASLGNDGQDTVRNFVRDGGAYIGVCAGFYLLTSARDELLDVQLTPKGQEVFGLTQSDIEVLYHNGPVVVPINPTDAQDIEILGVFKQELVGKGGKPGLMIGAPAMLLGHYGKGIVIGISPHPEASDELVSIYSNAINWAFKNRSN